MSLSTSIASSRGPRKPGSNICTKSTVLRGSSNSKKQSSNSEEEIAQRQQRRQANKTPCCIISLATSTSLPVSASLLILSATVVCLSFVHQMVTT